MSVHIEVDDESKLTNTDGSPVTVAELESSEGAFEFMYGKHKVKFDGLTSVSINGEKHKVQLPLHLDLSKMACCIGDACVMWPQ